MKNIIELINKRYSVRTYSNKKVEEQKIKSIEEYIESNCVGPFGNRVRFEFIDASEDDSKELKKLGTYGVMKGARLYISGAVKKADKDMEDFGYCMEKVILKVTELGLGTVWLGGMLNRSSFAERMGLSGDEIIPAVTPVGYADDNRSVMDRMAAFVIKARKRKDFGELFFYGNIETPLEEKQSNNYLQVLESVRLAPSASNKQPWRIIKEEDCNTFHMYLKEDKKYNNETKDVKIQNLDIGIAMSHFELTASQLGLEGTWKKAEPALECGELQYITSWVGK